MHGNYSNNLVWKLRTRKVEIADFIQYEVNLESKFKNRRSRKRVNLRKVLAGFPEVYPLSSKRPANRPGAGLLVDPVHIGVLNKFY
ncbi:MAG: hypothetical protein JWP00_1425 [Chloroflexi bacterium]|nr:hypothetical protein [Chloroflexota bacterium]